MPFDPDQDVTDPGTTLPMYSTIHTLLAFRSWFSSLPLVGRFERSSAIRQDASRGDHRWWSCKPSYVNCTLQHVWVLYLTPFSIVSLDVGVYSLSTRRNSTQTSVLVSDLDGCLCLVECWCGCVGTWKSVAHTYDRRRNLITLSHRITSSDGRRAPGYCITFSDHPIGINLVVLQQIAHQAPMFIFIISDIYSTRQGTNEQQKAEGKKKKKTFITYFQSKQWLKSTFRESAEY